MITFTADKRKIIGSILLLSLMFIVLGFLIFTSFYSISVTTTDGKNYTVRHFESSGKVVNSVSLFNIYMIPRSADVIEVSSANNTTRQFIRSKTILGINNVKINLKDQLATSTIGKNGLGCDGKTDEAMYFSYACFDSASNIIAYASREQGSHDNTLIARGDSVNRIESKSYSSGILSLVESDKGLSIEQRLINRTGVDTVVRQIQGTRGDSVALAVGSKGTDFIVVNNSTHELLYFDSFQTTTPKKITLSDEVLYSTCGLRQAIIVCAISGIEPEGDDHSHSSVEDDQLKDVKLIEISVKTSGQRFFDPVRLIDELCMTDAGFYSLEDDGKLYYYAKQNDYNRSLIANQTDTLICGENNAWYVSNKSIYVSSDGSSSLVFTTKRFDISNIQNINNELTFSSIINSDLDSTPYTFTLNKNLSSYPRIEESLPLVNSQTILESDYDDKTIFIKPVVSLTSDSQTGTTTVDEDHLARTKASIEAGLRKNGLLDSYTITYYGI